MDYYDLILAGKLSGGGGGSSGYTIDQIIDRTPITGDVVYDGDTTKLPEGCLSYSNITSFKSDKVTNSYNYAFYKCNNLETVELPNLVCGTTTDANYMFAECGKLKTLKIPKFKRCAGYFVQGCKALEKLVVPSIDYQFTGYFAYQCTALHTVDVGANIGANFAAGNAFNSSGITILILRRTAGVCALGSQTNFNNSPLASNGTGGHIYVPSSLLSSYQSASNWSSLNATWHTIESTHTDPTAPFDMTLYYADGTSIS